MTGISNRVYPRILDISKIEPASLPLGLKLWKASVGLYDPFSFILFALAKRFHIPKSELFLRPSRREQGKAIASASVWLSSGGGFINSHYKIELRFIGFIVAFILKIPVVIFAQSVGPFLNRKDRVLASYFLNRVNAIFLREADSLKYLKDLDIHVPIRVTSDVAFSLNAPKKDKSTERKVAICIKRTSIEYNRTIARFASMLIARGYKILLVSQTISDDDVLVEIAELIHGEAELAQFGIPPKVLKALYGECCAIVSSRMHAIVFASERGVPWIAISYEPKFIGLAQALGYDERLVIDENYLTVDILVKSFDSLMNNRARVARMLTAVTMKNKRNTIRDIKDIYKLTYV